MSRIAPVLSVVHALIQARSREELFRDVVRAIRVVLPSDLAGLAIIEGDQFVTMYTDPPVPAEETTRRSLGEWPASRSLAAGESRVVRRHELDAFPVALALWDRFGIQSSLPVPLIVAGRLMGAIINWSRDPDAYGNYDRDLVSELATVTAIALDRVLAFEEIEDLRRRAADDHEVLADEWRGIHTGGDLIGRDPSVAAVRRRVQLVAPTTATVLILGESGTGKDLVANAIHDASPRRAHPMVTLNCAALPAQLAESELFGHEQGAFTGAIRRRIGKFEAASGSTLFLDEIGELPLPLQAKLLRVLQERELERVGGHETICVDVRIVAATNRDLLADVAAGRFREDLYYRLSIFPVKLPPLRDRRGDIPALVDRFVRQAAERLNRPVRKVAPEAILRLCAYDWPGNVRELENTIERAMIVSSGDTLEIDPVVPRRPTRDLRRRQS